MENNNNENANSEGKRTPDEKLALAVKAIVLIKETLASLTTVLGVEEKEEGVDVEVQKIVNITLDKAYEVFDSISQNNFADVVDKESAQMSIEYDNKVEINSISIDEGELLHILKEYRQNIFDSTIAEIHKFESKPAEVSEEAV